MRGENKLNYQKSWAHLHISIPKLPKVKIHINHPLINSPQPNLQQTPFQTTPTIGQTHAQSQSNSLHHPTSTTSNRELMALPILGQTISLWSLLIMLCLVVVTKEMKGGIIIFSKRTSSNNDFTVTNSPPPLRKLISSYQNFNCLKLIMKIYKLLKFYFQYVISSYFRFHCSKKKLFLKKKITNMFDMGVFFQVIKPVNQE